MYHSSGTRLHGAVMLPPCNIVQTLKILLDWLLSHFSKPLFLHLRPISDKSASSVFREDDNG